jgi:hypothetical protein
MKNQKMKRNIDKIALFSKSKHHFEDIPKYRSYI